jgi:hypothetical protein
LRWGKFAGGTSLGINIRPVLDMISLEYLLEVQMGTFRRLSSEVFREVWAGDVCVYISCIQIIYRFVGLGDATNGMI